MQYLCLRWGMGPVCLTPSLDLSPEDTTTYTVVSSTRSALSSRAHSVQREREMANQEDQRLLKKASKALSGKKMDLFGDLLKQLQGRDVSLNTPLDPVKSTLLHRAATAGESAGRREFRFPYLARHRGFPILSPRADKKALLFDSGREPRGGEDAGGRVRGGE